MNVDAGQMGPLDELLKTARPGERVIPATIIPAPGKYANKRGFPRAMPRTVTIEPVEQPKAPVYGPRKPLREVRAELQAAKATEA